MVQTCCVRNCNNSVKEKYHFFRFPKKQGSEEKAKIWAERCGFTYDEIIAHPNWRICEGHFDISQFEIINSGYKQLKIDALPTIFTNNPAKSCSAPAEYLLSENEPNIHPCESICEKKKFFHVITIPCEKSKISTMDQISQIKYLKNRIVHLTRHNKILCAKNNKLRKAVAAGKLKFKKFLNKDQFDLLCRTTTTNSREWSSETIQKALQWYLILRHKGYEFLRKEQNIPLPSPRTLSRRKRSRLTTLPLTTANPLVDGTSDIVS